MRKTFEDQKLLHNDEAGAIDVWFEPWGMPHKLGPGETFRVLARSDEPGELELTFEDGAVGVYAWNGASVEVLKGELRVDFFPPFGAAFPGGSMKKSIGLLFGGPGGPRPMAETDDSEKDQVEGY